MPPTTPWLILGDFNVVYQMSECSDYYQGMPIPPKVLEFQNCIRKVGMVDIPSFGPLYTWSNRRNEGFLAKKLDKTMANSYWLNKFLEYEVDFLAPDISDHTTGWIKQKSSAPQKCKPFKFFNYLIKHPKFLSTVQNSWAASSVYGTMMFQLSKRLKALKPVIRALSKEHFQGIHLQVEEARKKLHTIQLDSLDLLSAPSHKLLLCRKNYTWQD